MTSVLLDAQCLLSPLTGVGRYTFELARALAARPEIKLTLAAENFAGRHSFRHPDPERVTIRERRWRPPRLLRWLRARWDWPPFNRAGEADLVHFPNFLVRPTRGVRVAVTVHDLAFVRFPEFIDPPHLAALKADLARGLKRADLVLTPSEFTRRELLDLHPLPPERVAATPLGVDPAFRPLAMNQATAQRLRSLFNLPERFFLFVGTAEPRKNLGALVRAYALLAQRGRPAAELVIAHSPGWGRAEERLRAEIRQLGIEPLVRLIGRVETEHLPELYNLAEALILPSFYEGFGLPVLEAMACGVPVACADAGALPEVAGEAAATFPPTDSGALAAVLSRLLADPDYRQGLGRRGRERAGRFGWDKTAALTEAAYRRTLGLD